MGSVLVAVFLGLLALAVGQAVIRRVANPYAELAYGELPESLRREVERLLPDFAPQASRITRRGDEARLVGEAHGGPVRIEADFDSRGELVDFEAEARVGVRKTGLASPHDLPEAASREVDRVLGADRDAFELTRISQGVLGDGERAFDVKGRSGDWTWEIEVSGTGRLLEVEKAKRRRRR